MHGAWRPTVAKILTSVDPWKDIKIVKITELHCRVYCEFWLFCLLCFSGGAKQVHPSPLLAANPSPQQFGPADPLSSTAPTFGTAGVFSTSQGSVFGGQGVPVSTAGIFSTSQGSAFGGQGAHMSQQTPGKGNETAPTSIFSSAGSNASSFGVGPSLANSTAGTASGSNTSSSTGAFGSTFGSGVVGPGTFGVPSSQTEQVSSSVGPAFPTSAVTSGSTAPLSFGGAPAGAGSFSFGNKPNPEPQTSDSSTGLLLKPSGFGSFSSPTGTGESSGFGGFTAAPETKLPAFGQSSGNSFAPPSFPSASLGSGISSNKTTGVFGQATSPTSPTSPGNVADKFGTLSTALVIREIPEVLNKNAWIKRFYSRFGEVVKVVCNAHKKSATVTFKTHVSFPPQVPTFYSNREWTGLNASLSRGYCIYCNATHPSNQRCTWGWKHKTHPWINAALK